MKRALILAGLFGGLLILLILPLTGVQRILFSPGNGVHDGKVACIECHVAFSSTPSCNNIACHPSLPGTYKTTASFQFHRLVANQACTTCHTEHAGHVDSFASRRFSHELFDVTQRNCATCHATPADSLHQNVGQAINCAGCHSTTAWKPAQFNHTGIAAANLNNCAACHTPPPDNHHQLYTPNCAVCHSDATWKPARFSHTGLSAQGMVSCGICHQAPRDDHGGAGLDCGRCHTTQSWGDD